jgi:hypothetical protein
MTTFHIGDTIRIQCEFKNIERVLTDPTTVTLEIKTPGGTTTSYTYAAGQLGRAAAGRYYFDLALSAANTWEYRWVGTGAVAQADQGQVHVIPKNT